MRRASWFALGVVMMAAPLGFFLWQTHKPASLSGRAGAAPPSPILKVEIHHQSAQEEPVKLDRADRHSFNYTFKDHDQAVEFACTVAEVLVWVKRLPNGLPPVPDKPVPDKPVPDKPVPDKPVPDKPVPDKKEEKPGEKKADKNKASQ